jgi:hypothetical protein
MRSRVKFLEHSKEQHEKLNPRGYIYTIDEDENRGGISK